MVIQRILCHSNASTRANYYIKTGVMLEPTIRLELMTCRLRIIVRSYRCSS
jgi:hypothetical protein